MSTDQVTYAQYCLPFYTVYRNYYERTLRIRVIPGYSLAYIILIMNARQQVIKFYSNPSRVSRDLNVAHTSRETVPKPVRKQILNCEIAYFISPCVWLYRSTRKEHQQSSNEFELLLIFIFGIMFVRKKIVQENIFRKNFQLQIIK